MYVVLTSVTGEMPTGIANVAACFVKVGCNECTIGDNSPPGERFFFVL